MLESACGELQNSQLYRIARQLAGNGDGQDFEKETAANQ